ncbi:MAG: hypothetical protein LBF97_01135 [Elusimicrobiota bacterium]|jgi:hypothetical protein|nr:hypothetical protein [Elusimicrobiota bacterium]
MSAGIKGKYERNIKPNFEYIKRWLREGATEKQCAARLRIGYSTWNKYKSQFVEFREMIEGVNKSEIINNLREALIKRAIGFEYEERKQYIKDKKNTCDGNKTTYTEIVKKYKVPDMSAIKEALKIYDEKYIKKIKNKEFKEEDLELWKASKKKNEP